MMKIIAVIVLLILAALIKQGPALLSVNSLVTCLLVLGRSSGPAALMPP
jgi:hypothetical protein